jgi:phage/plasmid-associated DNA primase
MEQFVAGTLAPAHHWPATEAFRDIAVQRRTRISVFTHDIGRSLVRFKLSSDDTAQHIKVQLAKSIARYLRLSR